MSFLIFGDKGGRKKENEKIKYRKLISGPGYLARTEKSAHDPDSGHELGSGLKIAGLKKPGLKIAGLKKPG